MGLKTDMDIIDKEECTQHEPSSAPEITVRLVIDIDKDNTVDSRRDKKGLESPQCLDIHRSFLEQEPENRTRLDNDLKSKGLCWDEKNVLTVAEELTIFCVKNLIEMDFTDGDFCEKVVVFERK